MESWHLPHVWKLQCSARSHHHSPRTCNENPTTRCSLPQCFKISSGILPSCKKQTRAMSYSKLCQIAFAYSAYARLACLTHIHRCIECLWVILGNWVVISGKRNCWWVLRMEHFGTLNDSRIMPASSMIVQLAANSAAHVCKTEQLAPKTV